MEEIKDLLIEEKENTSPNKWLKRNLYQEIKKLFQSNPPLLPSDMKKFANFSLNVINEYVSFHLESNFVHSRGFGKETRKSSFFGRLEGLSEFLDIIYVFTTLCDQMPTFKLALKFYLQEPNCQIIHHSLLNTSMSSDQRIAWLSFLFKIEPLAIQSFHTRLKYPLNLAVQYCDHQTIQFLILKGAKPTVDIEKNFNSCAFLGDIETMKFFLQHGATMTGETLASVVRGWFNLSHNGAIDGNGSSNSRGNHFFCLKFVKQSLSQWEFRQTSLDIRREYEKDQAFRSLSSDLFPQSKKKLRQIDLLPKNNLLVKWLRKVEFHLYTSGMDYPYEIILLIRDYLFPNYLVVGFDHKYSTPSLSFYNKINICPQFYLFPALIWLRIQKLNDDAPCVFTLNENEKGGCVDQKGKHQIMEDEITEMQLFTWKGHPLTWDCYHCPCQSHSSHTHISTVLKSMNIVGFYAFHPSTEEIENKQIPRAPRMILFYLNKYKQALEWEKLHGPEQIKENLLRGVDVGINWYPGNVSMKDIQEKEKGKEMCVEEEIDIEIQEFLQLRDTKLMEVNKIRQSVEAEVQMWYITDVFFSLFNV